MDTETVEKKKPARKKKSSKKAKTKKKKTAKKAAKKSDGSDNSRPARQVDGLVIVESPAKAKTIKKYLGRKFEVKASVGHIKDLPKSKIGVDVENEFEPTYETIKGKEKKIEEILKAASKAKRVYLAPDPDREGEAIAWHVAEALPTPKANIYRVLFNEITKPMVLKAMENPLPLDKAKYESQQARRILDRLVGYKISPILWTKVRRGLSAGRVQSVAVRLICDREGEIRAFKPQDYWSVEAKVSVDGKDKKFPAHLAKIEGKRFDKLDINSAEMAEEIVKASKEAEWKIAKVQTRERRRNPTPPFITSTMQQESSKRHYFTAKRTMRIAQQLYEGIELGEEGATGLITYMRTDSTRISDQALTEVREIIKTQYGDKFLPKEPNIYKSKKKAQDAHEAIRPTSAARTPELMKQYLDADQFKLYSLVWKRFVASQMEPAVFDQKTIEFDIAGSNGKPYGYRSSGSVLKFPGFLTLWQTEEDDADENDGLLPELDESSRAKPEEIKSEKHQTQPPPRYSESSLIKELEEKGIGRPSTYASILSTIQDRKYVEKRENRFFATELGEIVTELLVESFKNIVDVGFTANMENQLDQIEEGALNWKKTLKGFYGPFEKTLKEAETTMRDVKREETPTGLTCPKCKADVILKWGRNGKFAACKGYPDCRFTSEYEQTDDGKIKLIEQPTTDEKCEKCDSPMVVKMGRFGRFLACSTYPKCKSTKAITTGIDCPECKKGQLAEKRTRFGKRFFSCTKYPNCKFAIWDKPLKETSCPQCKFPFLVERYTKKDGVTIRCSQKECGFIQKAEEGAEPDSKQAQG